MPAPRFPLIAPVRLLAISVASIVFGAGCASSSAATVDDDPAAVPAPQPAVSSASVDAESVSVGNDVVPDEAVVAMLAPLSEQVAARAKRVIGELATPLIKADDGEITPESTLGNWATDAMRRQMNKATGRDIDICFTNNGGLRRSLPAGPVTEGVVVELMPFDNAVVILDVKGDRARELLTLVVDRGEPASGFTYVRDAERKPVEMKVGGEPLDDARSYSICTNDYLYEGGGDFAMEDIKTSTYTGILIRDAFIAEFEDKQAAGEKIGVELDGRAVELKPAEDA